MRPRFIRTLKKGVQMRPRRRMMNVFSFGVDKGISWGEGAQPRPGYLFFLQEAPENRLATVLRGLFFGILRIFGFVWEKFENFFRKFAKNCCEYIFFCCKKNALLLLKFRGSIDRLPPPPAPWRRPPPLIREIFLL